MRYRLTPMTEGRVKRSAETDERRSRIIDAAMNRFSRHGYRATHVEDIAHEVGVAKGTVFLDFGSKEGLFLAAYQHAVQMLPAWLDAPEEVVRGGLGHQGQQGVAIPHAFVQRRRADADALGHGLHREL